MKHKILVLGMIICCLFGLTACGEETKDHNLTGTKYAERLFSEDFLEFSVNDYEDLFEQLYLYGLTPDNFMEKAYPIFAVQQDNYTGEVTVDDEFYNTLYTGYVSWYKAIEDIGFNSEETLQDDVNVTDWDYEITKDGDLVAQAIIQGTKRSAEMNIYFNPDTTAKDIGVTVMRSDSEKLSNAGLNTLLGMGMAFAILIIIALIISLFPMLFGSGRKKKESDKEIAQKAMDNTISQIAEQEDLSSDAELVAVIAAAIAAYEGSGSTDGFQVRSIRRVNSNWKKY